MTVINALSSYWPQNNIASSLGAPISGLTSDDYNYYTIQ
jgi:hypothetical protein